MKSSMTPPEEPEIGKDHKNFSDQRPDGVHEREFGLRAAAGRIEPEQGIFR
jgi:hypothetical protein